MYSDSHAHLTCDAVFPQVEEILQRAQDAGVEFIINICTDIPTLERGLELQARHPLLIYNTASTTPHDVDAEGESVFPVVAAAAREGKLVAVGETGLDYHYNYSTPENQQRFLRRYLQLALECQLPVVIHCRDAFADFFHILDEEYVVDGRHAPGVLHCFTGTLEEATQVIERDWYLSLSGIVTFKRSEELRQVAQMVPLNRLLIETDTPYLAPQKYRGKPNEPSYLPEVAKTIAQVKGLTTEEVAQACMENTRTLFMQKALN